MVCGCSGVHYDLRKQYVKLSLYMSRRWEEFLTQYKEDDRPKESDGSALSSNTERHWLLESVQVSKSFDYKMKKRE